MSRRKHKKNKRKCWQRDIIKGNSNNVNSFNPLQTNTITQQHLRYGNNWLKSCEHSPVHVFSIGDDPEKQIEFYGATKDKIGIYTLPDTTLILNVSGFSLQSSTTDLVKGPREFDCLKALIPQIKIKELILSWTDGASFSAGVDFWQKFYDICVEQGYKKVIVCCIGGHGRTGTALAAILIANAGMTDYDAIDLIREHYCIEAIETKTQDFYLERLYFELNPEEKEKRNAQITIDLTKTVPNDKVVIDMKTGEIIDSKQLEFSKSNIDSYENKKCAWCGVNFIGDKDNQDDIACSEECAQSVKEFTGYDLRC